MIAKVFGWIGALTDALLKRLVTLAWRFRFISLGMIGGFVFGLGTGVAMGGGAFNGAGLFSIVGGFVGFALSAAWAKAKSSLRKGKSNANP